ncbi:DUF6461 domain-containing protein [Nocardia sp. NPDC004415]
MGWQAQGVIVEGTVDPAGLPGRPRDTGERVDLDEVHRRPCDYGVAEVDGWTFLADPDMRVTFDDEVLEGLSGSGRVLAWVSNSVSTVHGFGWYRDGELVRRIVYVEGEVADEYGPALAAETNAPDNTDEDFVFEMMWRLTGLGWGVGADAVYSEWACTEETAG